MKALRSGYFNPNPFIKDIRTRLVIFGFLLAGAVAVLVLQSWVYASSFAQLWKAGQALWDPTLTLILQILTIWAFVLGVVFAIQSVTLPVTKYGGEFWSGVMTYFPLGLALPFALVLAGGLAIYIPLGLLSLLVTDVFAFATLQFAWLMAGYLVFLWIVTGMVPLLAAVFMQRRWYYKFIAILLYIQLTLDLLQAGMNALQNLLKNSIWQTNNIALLAAIFGTLLVSSVVVQLAFRGQPTLTTVFAIIAVYIASVVTGNFSERLFGWGEIPSAVVALLSPLLYVQAAKWILRNDGTAVAGLAAGYAGLLTGLLIDQLLQLRITGHSWLSLLWGIIVVLGLGLTLGYFLGRRLTKLVANRLMLLPNLLRYMDIGVVAGLMAGMLVGGFLAR